MHPTLFAWPQYAAVSDGRSQRFHIGAVLKKDFQHHLPLGLCRPMHQRLFVAVNHFIRVTSALKKVLHDTGIASFTGRLKHRFPMLLEIERCSFGNRELHLVPAAHVDGVK